MNHLQFPKKLTKIIENRTGSPKGLLEKTAEVVNKEKVKKL
jgi:hypothetical protein